MTYDPQTPEEREEFFRPYLPELRRLALEMLGLQIDEERLSKESPLPEQ